MRIIFSKHNCAYWQVPLSFNWALSNEIMLPINPDSCVAISWTHSQDFNLQSRLSILSCCISLGMYTWNLTFFKMHSILLVLTLFLHAPCRADFWGQCWYNSKTAVEYSSLVALRRHHDRSLYTSYPVHELQICLIDMQLLTFKAVLYNTPFFTVFD